MRDFFKGCVIVLVTLLVIILVLFFSYREYTKRNLSNQLGQIEQTWQNLIIKEDAKNRKILDFVKETPLKDSDSLIYGLENYFLEQRPTSCNSDFVYNEYLLNKYFLHTFESTLKDQDLLNDNHTLNDIMNDIETQNSVIRQYNTQVRVYNTFIRTFPNSIIARLAGFKTQTFFEIDFGVFNKDPELIKNERFEWMKKIEKEHGIYE